MVLDLFDELMQVQIKFSNLIVWNNHKYNLCLIVIVAFLNKTYLLYYRQTCNNTADHPGVTEFPKTPGKETAAVLNDIMVKN